MSRRDEDRLYRQVERLKERIAELEALVRSQADRIYRQSELLARCAGRLSPPPAPPAAAPAPPD